jgi:hypothetical protein
MQVGRRGETRQGRHESVAGSYMKRGHGTQVGRREACQGMQTGRKASWLGNACSQGQAREDWAYGQKRSGQRKAGSQGEARKGRQARQGK